MPSFPPQSVPYTSTWGFPSYGRRLFGALASALSYPMSPREAKNAAPIDAHLREIMGAAAASGNASELAAVAAAMLSQAHSAPRPGSSVMPIDIGLVRNGATGDSFDTNIAHRSPPARSRSASWASEPTSMDILQSVRASLMKDRQHVAGAGAASAVNASMLNEKEKLVMPTAATLGLTVNVPPLVLDKLLTPVPVTSPSSIAAGAMAVSTNIDGVITELIPKNIAPIPLTRQTRSASGWDHNSVDNALQRTTDTVALSIHSILSNNAPGYRRPRILVFSTDAQFRAAYLADVHGYDSRPLTSIHDTKHERDGLYYCNDVALLSLCHPSSFDVIMCFNLGAGAMNCTRGRRQITWVVREMEKLLRPGGCFTGTGIFRGATKMDNDVHTQSGEEYPRVSLPAFRDIVEDQGFYMHTAMDMSLEGNVVLKVAHDAAEPSHPLDLVRSGQLCCGRFLATKHSKTGAYSHHRHIVSVMGNRRTEFKETKQLSRLQIARSNKAKDDAKANILATNNTAIATAAAAVSTAVPSTPTPLPAASTVVAPADEEKAVVVEQKQGAVSTASSPSIAPIIAPIVKLGEVKQTVSTAAVESKQASAPAAPQSCEAKEAKRVFVKPTHDVKESGSGGINENDSACGVVITGTALGLPNDLYAGRAIFDPANVASIFAGDNFISNYTNDEKKAMLGMNIVQVSKTKEGKRLEHTLTRDNECIQVGSKIGQFDLAREYGVPAIIVETLDTTYQLAIAAGIEALRDAGILAPASAPKAAGAVCKPLALPLSMQDETGVIFACSFPGLDSMVEEVTRSVAARTRRELLDELKGGIARALHINLSIAPPVDPKDAHAAATYQYNRKLLFKILVMANAQLAELITAKGPNTQINSACSGNTQAIAMAEDWIRSGRCRRVVVVSADNPTSKELLPYLGTGFLALGAASTAPSVGEAAVPFDKRRKGMILGSGAVSLVLESVNTAMARQAPIKAELLGSSMKNSAFHASLMSKEHIGSEMSRFIDKMIVAHRISDTNALANDLIYFSHETCTSANGGCAQVEMDALATSFGVTSRSNILVANTKGFTGHAMAVSIEDVMAVQSLVQNKVPPIANHKMTDPALGDIQLSRGGSHTRRYVLRLAAGFGSQFVMLMLRKWDDDRVAFWQQRQLEADIAKRLSMSPLPSPLKPSRLFIDPLAATSFSVAMSPFGSVNAAAPASAFAGVTNHNNNNNNNDILMMTPTSSRPRSRSLDDLASPFYIRMPLVSPLPSPSSSSSSSSSSVVASSVSPVASNTQ